MRAIGRLRTAGRLRWIGLAGVVLLVSATIALVASGRLHPTPAQSQATAPKATATVARRTIIAQEKVSGTLGYSGKLHVVNETETGGIATDLAALNRDFVSAQAEYDNAVRTLEAIKRPTAQNIASARAQVRSAQAALTTAQIAARGATASQLAVAQAQLAQAQSTLATARLTANGPTASQLAAARAQLAQAQASLVTAQNTASGPTSAQRTQAEAAVAHAQINLTADSQALSAAQQTLATCQSGTPPTDCSTEEQAVIGAQARIASDEQDLRVAQAQLDALNSPAGQSEAAAALAAAQAQVTTAQAALDALTGSDATTTAQTQLAAAEAAARAAQATLDDLASPDAKSERTAQRRAAEAQLLSAQASLAAILHPTAAALAEARSKVAVAKAGLDGAEAKLRQLRGTVTRLPDVGTVVERGESLLELDGQPSSVLLYGARPAWRTMAPGSDGDDVKQLQENLLALGFGTAKLKASGHYDDETNDAAKRWQKTLKRPQTGVVELGDVVFLGGAVRVASHSVNVGDTVTAGTEVLTATSTARVVVVQLDADRQSLVSPGDAVSVDLPDGTTATGKIATVSSTATAPADGQGGKATIEVTIVLDDPAASGTVDQAPVEVRITTLSRPGVLAVPVNAPLALSEGGYAVEVASDDGTTHLVGVKTGIFQDGWVEVSVPNGGLTEGDLVVVPS